MANPHKGDVPFHVGSTVYTLCYSHLALVKLEKALDKNVVQIMQELQEAQTNMRISTIVALLWAGLQKHHPSISFDQAADLLDDIDGGSATAMEIIGESFQKAFAAPGTKATNPPQPNGGIGMISGSNTSPMDLSQIVSGVSRQGN